MSVGRFYKFLFLYIKIGSVNKILSFIILCASDVALHCISAMTSNAKQTFNKSSTEFHKYWAFHSVNKI